MQKLHTAFLAAAMALGLGACVGNSADNPPVTSANPPAQSGEPIPATPQAAQSASADALPGAWLQPRGHTREALQAAYADNQLDSKDTVYFAGDLVYEQWRAASKRSGEAGSVHGYRNGFADLEFVVIENNAYVQQAALGKLPSVYLKDMKQEIIKAVVGKSSKVTLAPCDQVHVRFSETGWMPPGNYPLRDAKGKDRGAVEMIVHKRYPQAVAPVFNSVMVLVVPIEPIRYPRNPEANPTVSFGVIEGGKEVPLQFLPTGNTTNRVQSTPANLVQNRLNDLHKAARDGAILFGAIVPPGACK